MENRNPDGGTIFIIGLIVGLMLMSVIMWRGMQSYYRAELIKYGYGQYHPQTAEFEWVEKK